MKKIINFIVLGLTLHSYSIHSSVGVKDDLRIFCSSGAFLYNYLDINEDQGQLGFHAYGTSSFNFSINTDVINIDQMLVSDIKFFINKDDCSTNAEESVISCTLENVSLLFIDPNENIFIQDLEDVSVKVVEGKSFGSGKFLVEKEGVEIISQKLTSCADLTGLN